MAKKKATKKKTSRRRTRKKTTKKATTKKATMKAPARKKAKAPNFANDRQRDRFYTLEQSICAEDRVKLEKLKAYLIRTGRAG